MSRQEIFHVRLGKRRTTISVDKIVSTLLALHLDAEPGTIQAHAAVRAYFQSKLDESSDPGRHYVTAWLREQALFDVLDNGLSKKYWAWFDKSQMPGGKKVRSQRRKSS